MRAGRDDAQAPFDTTAICHARARARGAGDNDFRLQSYAELYAIAGCARGSTMTRRPPAQARLQVACHAKDGRQIYP